MRRRRLDPFDRRSMALSIVIHLLFFALSWTSSFPAPAPMTYVAYEIDLVSPPPAIRAEDPRPATQDLVLERPAPQPAASQPQTRETDESRDLPSIEVRPGARTEEAEPELADTVADAAGDVDPAAEVPDVTGESLTVRIEGLRRDYPAYYEGIISAILDCFRWRNGGRWRTTLDFHIERDGSVSSAPEFVTRSGNVAFDFEAMGAVECAGRGRFGPLPEDLPFDRLGIRFTFRPGNPIPDPRAASDGRRWLAIGVRIAPCRPRGIWCLPSDAAS